MSETAWLTPTTNEANSLWNNPSNMGAEDAVYASANDDACTVRQYTFGISIPGGATINGVAAALKGYTDSAFPPMNVSLALMYNGRTTQAPVVKQISLTETNQKHFVGDSTDKWGRSSWAVSDFSTANFALRVFGVFAWFYTAYVDVVEVKIYYNIGGFLNKIQSLDPSSVSKINTIPLSNINKINTV